MKNGQHVYPAADLSEQISTAGKEASGTGNMKFAMNGALTIGTLDGANVEIREAVGAENFFLFGLTADEVDGASARGYDPRACYDANAELREAHRSDRLGLLLERRPRRCSARSSTRCSSATSISSSPTSTRTSRARRRSSEAYRDVDRWTRMSILNVARMGWFSSDRAIREYCEQIWHAVAVPIEG